MIKKVLIVFGTRPEAIKMAPVIKGLEKSESFKPVVCVTAQHREMLDQVLNLFEIKPEFDLDIMSPGQDLFDITSKILISLRDILRNVKPDLVLIHGDTTTCFSAGLAAFYEKIPVGHIEAGLRTKKMYSPFPEEANRTLTGVIAKYHFAPTKKARENLIEESHQEQDIVITGNTVIDALLQIRDTLSDYPNSKWVEIFGESIFNSVNNISRKKILITGHRRENFGQGFIDLCSGIRELSLKHTNWDFIYPVHLNPNVQKPVNDILNDIPNVYLIKPLDYLPFVWIMNKCDLILTDSGGVQEEGPSLGKPVLVMRDITERPEAVEAGTVLLVGTDSKSISKNVENILFDKEAYKKMSLAHNPYGDGKAVNRIINFLENNL